MEIFTLSNLITIFLDKKKCMKYNFNYDRVFSIVPNLIEINNMIGLDKIKEKLIYQIIYFLKTEEPTNMMHTVILGNPGLGKSHFSILLGKIICKLCFKSKKPIIKSVNRSDLISGYLGQTAIKTQEVINSVSGGVLIIDECYSLGDTEKRDSFSKECIDTINQNLTERCKEFACIIAGYRDDLLNRFFGSNKGLLRRFRFIYEMEDYNGDELYKIFLSFLYNEGWLIGNDVKKNFFIENRKEFIYNAGDIENFVFDCKMKSVYRQSIMKNIKKEIIKIDMDNALIYFKNNRIDNKIDNKTDSKEEWKEMYL